MQVILYYKLNHFTTRKIMKTKFLLSFFIAVIFFPFMAKAQTGEYVTINKNLTSPGATDWISFRTEHTITSLQVKYPDGSLVTINRSTFPSNSNYSTFYINNLTATDLPVTVYGVQDTLIDVGTDITSIDLSNNPSLEYLGVNGNKLTSLDVSHNQELKQLVASYNKITSLDISQNPLLETVAVQDNEIASFITSPAENHTLKTLYIHNNQIPGIDLTGYKDLVHIQAENNKLTELDVTQNTALVFLSAGNNLLTSLDISQNTALQDLWLSDNDIAQLDISQNALLVSLTVDNNELHGLDISGNPVLERLSYSGNYITSIDASNNPNISSINLVDNDYGPGDILPKPDGMDLIFYTFSPQKRFTFPQTTYSENSILDLSNQLTAKGIAGPNGTDVTTVFTWVDSNGNPLTEGTDFEVTEPGKFKFLHAMSGIYLIMQNSAYNYQEEIWDDASQSIILVDKSLYTHNGIDSNTGEYIIDTDAAGNSIFRTVALDITAVTPVTLQNFSGSVQNGHVILQWKTGTELNAKGFEIERSADANSFENIGFVFTKGSNSSYTYTDVAPFSGKNIYRLKMTNLDGTASYSSLVTLTNTAQNNNLQIFPNPASNGIVNIVSANAVKANIYNSGGVMVKTISLQKGRNTIDIRNLSAGVYFVKTNEGNTSRFVVVR